LDYGIQTNHFCQGWLFGVILTKFYRMSKPLLSVVITVYNEEDNIQPLLEATYSALSEIDYEVILI
jgi:hypothetical protein